MTKNHKDKVKSKSKSKSKSAVSKDNQARNLDLSSSSPTANGITSNRYAPSSAPSKTTLQANEKATKPGSFSSPIAMRVPRDLRSSPGDIAQQTLKRKREDGRGRAQLGSTREVEFGDISKKMKTKASNTAMKDGNQLTVLMIDSKESEDEVNRDWEDVKSQDEDGNGELLSGIHAAAKGKQEEEEEAAAEGLEGQLSGSISSSSSDFGSSSGSPSKSSSTSSSSEDENEDMDGAENEDIDSETETEELPLKRLNRKHPTIFGNHAPVIKTKTSVATRNPPPPELEGQFKFTNSIIGNHVYRYPKPVLDVLVELEKIIPQPVVGYIKNNPGGKSKLNSTLMHEHWEGNEDTKRMIVALESAKHLIVHLGKARACADGKAAGAGMAEELMRIARERGEDIEFLRREVRAMREKIEEGRGKKKRRS